METGRKAIIWIVFCLMSAALLSMVFPKERPHNDEAVIRIGAGDDVSGILMDEIVDELSDSYEVAENLESTSFHDC